MKYNISRYGFPRFPTNKTVISNPLPPDIDEDKKNSIMKNREIILEAVKKGLNQLEDIEEKYDEKLPEQNKNDDNVEVDELSNSKYMDDKNKDEVPNSVETEKFLIEMCLTSDEYDNNEDVNPKKKSKKKSDEFDINNDQNPKKESNKKTKEDVIKAFHDFKEAMEEIGLLKDLDKSENVNVYQNALSISDKGRNVILKRKVSERNINNYNELFHSVWQANTDIQLALDTHAVISYISDYITKSDQGLTKHLEAALNEKKNASRFEQLNHVKKTYFTHRQTCVAEAAYRIIPGLNLKDSNIKTMFLTSGFPSNRWQYFRQIPEDERQDEGMELEGREGKFQTSMSKIDIYNLRPKDENSIYSKGQLEKMCMAEYFMNYDKVAEKDCPKQKYKYEELYQKENGEIVSALVHEDIKNDETAKLICGIGFERMLEGKELQGFPKIFFFVNDKGSLFF